MANVQFSWIRLCQIIIQCRKRSTSQPFRNTPEPDRPTTTRPKIYSSHSKSNKGIKYWWFLLPCTADYRCMLCTAHSLNSDYLCFSFVFFSPFIIYYFIWDCNFFLRSSPVSPSRHCSDWGFFYDRIKEYVRRGNGEAVFRNYTSARGFQTAGNIGYLCTVECTIALSKLLGLMRFGADVFCCNQNFLSISFFFFRSGVKNGRSVCAM